ncbi:phosphoglycerate mutase [Lapidilactobacillus dextrinicus DSM 20335]|uniref:Phosphoglycerate mutase n=2 Tax=Lapidilactobacillus dextrinicus TaxID=51664 RepID=A0A0R2BJG6_9LACO|nr:phosphoglycerate mutase [Lapidilactobacillus dextrinicus DSM 20335]QFG47594.1 histidine phosphatase family protein [Lapidilactobacillus dextrinicus]
MRHGQTRFNELHRIQGASDSPLTALGIDQAKQARAFIQDVTFDHAYCSTQERASDTLEIVTENQISYTRLKGLKEYDFGVFEGQSEQLNPKITGDNGYGDFFVQFGGESADQVAQRMDQTITEIMMQPDNQQVLIVSHGGAIFSFARLHFDAAGILGHGFKNLSTLIFTFDTETQAFTYQKVLTLASLTNK